MHGVVGADLQREVDAVDLQAADLPQRVERDGIDAVRDQLLARVRGDALDLNVLDVQGALPVAAPGEAPETERVVSGETEFLRERLAWLLSQCNEAVAAVALGPGGIAASALGTTSTVVSGGFGTHFAFLIGRNRARRPGP